ncbi:MAG: HU family DNA-binding protein [Pyrinomonadaceae bacterium]
MVPGLGFFGRRKVNLAVKSCFLLLLATFATHGFGSWHTGEKSESLTLAVDGRRGENMTKAELVEDVAKAAELTKKDAERLVEIVFESIIDTLNQGEKIELRGFGSFRVRERGSRRGRNPKTGDPVDIPAKRIPYFKPGKELKELINAASVGDETPA